MYYVFCINSIINSWVVIRSMYFLLSDKGCVLCVYVSMHILMLNPRATFCVISLSNHYHKVVLYFPMATYFAGNPGVTVGEGSSGGLQTMILMNPSAYVHFNSDQDPPPNATGNFSLFNPSATGNLLSSSPQAPPQQQFTDNNNNNFSVLHGFIPRVYATPEEAARETPRSQQGLSLSLSSDRSSNPSFGSGHVVFSGTQGLALSSKYLKAVQELLDEVVSVNDTPNTTEHHNNSKSLLSKKNGESSGGAEASGVGPTMSELTTAERHEIQMKKAKLVTMLDEVEQRYRQYNNQMQILVSSFEQATGTGSAKTYTCLALKTISKQFKCLKHAIIAQIKAVNKILGEEDSKVGGGSRLKFVDHHIRQHHALQRLGMAHHTTNAWRPQRGLPDKAVSVLRAWLFENFLHPYPKDSDKVMLARQAGLTRSQVSNWFINARVRLWKPMVEEMYLEEIKEQGKNNGSLEEKDNLSKHDRDKDSSSRHDKSLVSEIQQSDLMNNNGYPSVTASITTASSGLEVITQGSPKKLRTDELIRSHNAIMAMNMGPDDGISATFRHEKGLMLVPSNTAGFMEGFGQYPVGETSRFETESSRPSYSGSNNNGVSLTLGLPHGESFSISATHQNFFPNQNIELGRTMEMAESNEFGAINTSDAQSSAAEYTMSLQSQRRFCTQLLPDYVT